MSQKYSLRGKKRQKVLKYVTKIVLSFTKLYATPPILELITNFECIAFSSLLRIMKS